MRVLPLRYADAGAIVGYLGGVSAAGSLSSEQAGDQFARDSARAGQATTSRGQQEPLFFAQAQVATDGGGGPVLPLPPGLTQPLVALPDQNAILAQGSLDAIDRLQELIGLLDRPTPLVNVEVRMVDHGVVSESDWGMDFGISGDGVGAGAEGNVPGGGFSVRWNGLTGWVLAGGGEHVQRSRAVTAASVTTPSGSPAALRIGEVVPYVTSQVTYDQFGQRHVDTQVQAAFFGFELLVWPRVVGRDWVVVRLRPAITASAGVVVSAEGNSVPVTRNTLAETTVRLRSGESLAIAGWCKLVQDEADKLGGALGERDSRSTSSPVILVTPEIIWPALSTDDTVR